MSTEPLPFASLPRWNRWLAWLLRALLAAMLFVAAWSKWHPPYPLDVPQSRTIFDDTFPPGTARRAAFIVVELATAAWLVVGWRPRAALLWTAMLLIVFSGVIGYELTRPDPRSCGCLPLDPNTLQPIDVRATLWQSLGRNAVALLTIAWSFFLLRAGAATASGRPTPPPAAA